MHVLKEARETSVARQAELTRHRNTHAIRSSGDLALNRPCCVIDLIRRVHAGTKGEKRTRGEGTLPTTTRVGKREGGRGGEDFHFATPMSRSRDR